MSRTTGLALTAIVLVLALSGGALAASQITGRDIANSTITGKDVKNRSLTKRDFRGSVRGPRGVQGPQGPQGPPGPTVVGQITIVRSAQVPFSSSPAQSATAFCPSGQRVVSGGGVDIGDEQLAATESNSDRSGWFVIGVDLVDNGGEYVQAEALCAPAGQAVAATWRARALEQVERLEARIAARYGGRRR